MLAVVALARACLPAVNGTVQESCAAAIFDGRGLVGGQVGMA